MRGILQTIDINKLADYTVDGATLATATEFVVAFNNLTSSGSTVVNTSYPDTFYADSITIGATEVQLTTAAKSGWMTVKSATTNTDEITVGATGLSDGDGFVLQTDDEILIETADLSKIYAISGTASQEVHIIGSYKA